MDAARPLLIGSIVILLFSTVGTADSFSPADRFHRSALNVILDLKEVIAKKLGVKSEELRIVDYEFEDSLIGQSAAYEFDLEVDRKVLPLKILEDVKNWRSLDSSVVPPMDAVLGPFDLSGPMELWIQDGQGMRLSLPHDVDAGEVKKVILSDGATVTVRGAKAVILRRPVDLPSSPNATLSSLGHHLRHASICHPHDASVSLRIVGPSALTVSPASTTTTSATPPAGKTPPAPINRLKVKRLGPGQLQLSSPTSQVATETPRSLPVTGIVPIGIWPLTSLNASDPKLAVFQQILTNAISASGKPNGSPSPSVRLTRAETSIQTFVKMTFVVEWSLDVAADDAAWKEIPAWWTRPKVSRMHFEAVARLEGDVLRAEMLNQVQPYVLVNSSSEAALLGNETKPVRLELLPMFPPSLFIL